MQKKTGTLFLVATPIGNLEDITHRALRVLSEVDVIAAEDTRHSLKLLNHFGIKKPLISYHDNNRISRARELADKLLGGENIALISDAGMPGISDPGEELVALCISEHINVTVIPGCSASLTALVLSGLSTDRFAFEGFLPQKHSERVKQLKQIVSEERTLIFYEGPHRVKEMLKDTLAVLGDRKIALARELTKLHEEVLRGTVSEMLSLFEKQDPRGEFVIIVAGSPRNSVQKETPYNDLSLEEHVAVYVEQGYDRMDAMKQAAKDRGLTKREIYASLAKDRTQ